MGMPCEINSVLKLKRDQGYPDRLALGDRHRVQKEGYRILPMDVPIALVDDDWTIRADIAIGQLTWHRGKTVLEFAIVRLYDPPISARA